jgi:adenylate cyclase
MFELIAQGTNVDSRWRRQVVNEIIEVGRATPTFRVPWDSQISRRHVRLTPKAESVLVEKLEVASNPVFFNGHEETSFELSPGQHFVIGKTSFTLAADRAFVSMEVPDPISQKTYSPEFLRQLPYRDANRRIDVLNRIPEAISSSGNREDLLIQMVNTLMAGIASASTIGIVRLNPAAATSDVIDPNSTGTAIEIIHWDRRGFERGDFQPSESLIRQTVESDLTSLHVWNQQKRVESQYTYDYENDWAFVSPIHSDASPGWGIYVAGTNRGSGSGSSGTNRTSAETDLQGDIKFCELVGSTLKNLLLVKQLERQQSSLRAFFSPVVMDAFVGRDPEEVLTPRKCDMTVMFCDLREFSKVSEAMADNLFELLERVSDSMGIMTHKILDHGGVIGDFHGDSAMGFWGWPLEGAQSGLNAANAIKAAIEIKNAFRQVQQNNQNENDINFRIAIGIASGESVAGKIGTQDQVKVTAFGPVVNLASRLEGMTRWLGGNILVDGETADRIGKGFGMDDPARPDLRRLGSFQPFGFKASFEVFEVFAKDEIEQSRMLVFHDALHYFQIGDWGHAQATLKAMPDDDSARNFLEGYMSENNNLVPDDWDGVVRMQAK